MDSARHVLSVIAVGLLSQSFVWAQAATSGSAPTRFGIATVHLEQNATDGDAEVVFEIVGGDDGLSKLTVKAPDGRVVVDATAPDSKTLGIRQFRFESPEPTDIKALKLAYPEGVYTFDGATASGKRLHSTATLNHRLAAAVSLARPITKADRLPTKNLSFNWAPAKGLAGYVVYVEQNGVNVSVTANLPGTAHGFAMPEGFLTPGASYHLGIGAVTEHGNISFVETTFVTDKQ